MSKIESSLTFKAITLDVAYITCIALNQLSTVSSQSALEVEKIGIPCPPVKLRAEESGTKWSLLKWELDSNCGEKFLHVSSYTLGYIGPGSVIRQLVVNGDSLLFNVSDLRPNTPYQVSCLHRMDVY